MLLALTLFGVLDKTDFRLGGMLEDLAQHCYMNTTDQPYKLPLR